MSENVNEIFNLPNFPKSELEKILFASELSFYKREYKKEDFDIIKNKTNLSAKIEEFDSKKFTSLVIDEDEIIIFNQDLINDGKIIRSYKEIIEIVEIYSHEILKELIAEIKSIYNQYKIEIYNYDNMDYYNKYNSDIIQIILHKIRYKSFYIYLNAID